MSAYFIATLTVKNPELFQQYATKSADTFKPYNGEIITRGKYIRALAGDNIHQASAVVKFSSPEDLEKWYNSQPYQDLIGLRDEAADIQITAYESPE